MGCFSACFGRCSNGYKKIGRHHEVLHQKIEPTREAQIADHLKIIEESVKSAVFDDLNLTNQEEEVGGSQTLECANQVTGEEENRSVIVLPEELYSEEKAVGEQGVKNQQKFQKENPEEEKEEKTEGDEEKKLGEEISEETGRDEIPLSDSSESSLFTYPTNIRYKNCAEISDDECEDFVDEDEVVSSNKVKESDANGGSSMIPEDSSESSLFSLSIDSRRRQSFTPGGGTVGDDKEEVSSKTFITTIPSDDNDTDKDKDKHIDSVLKPIENLGQWKKIVRKKAKSSSTMEKNQEQENVDSEEFTFPFQLKKKTSNTCRVDTSLSSWLLDSEISPEGSVGNSSSSLKNTKSSSSLRRRSQSFSPDETPIFGTVGSYWKHTGSACRQAMDTVDSGSSMSLHNQTNPFQTRLQEAMDSVK